MHVASATAPRFSVRDWTGLILVLGVSAVAIALVRWSGPPIYDGDGYFHIRYAQWIRDEGISRSFPWFQESFLRDRFANFNLLYHLLLIPFTFGDLLTGARVAAVGFAAAVMGVFYVSARRLEIPHAALLSLAVLAFCPDALFRYTFTRPVVLSIAVVLGGTTAILLGRRRETALWSAAFAWVHCSYHALPAVALFHDLTRDVAPGTRFLSRFRTTAWALGGAFAGTLLNPYFPNNVRFWWIANVGVLSNSWLRGAEVRMGTEMLPLPASELLARNVGVFAAFGAAIGLLVAARRASSEARTLLAVAAGFLGLACLSQRFVELWAPFTMLSLGVALRDRGRSVPWLRSLASVAVAVGLVASVRSNRDALVGDPSGALEPAGAWIAEHVPEGETIFNLGWDDFPELFFHAPRHRYLIGLDPTFFHATDPERAGAWWRIASGRDPDPYPGIRDTFRSRYVVVPARYVSITKRLERDPRFRPRFKDRGATVYELVALGPFVTRWEVPRAPEGKGPDPLEPTGAFVDLDRLSGAPPEAKRTCAVARTVVVAEGATEGELGITTDDAFEVRVDGEVVLSRSPLPGSPGGPPFRLEDLDPLRRRIEEATVRVSWNAGTHEIRVEACRVGEDLGFFLRVPAPLDPHRSPLEVLLLPDGNGVLEGVDREPARVERLGAMVRRDGDGDRNLADLEAADAMDDRDSRDAELRDRLDLDLLHLGDGHRSVGFVFEERHAAPVVVVADDADEQRQAAVGVGADRAEQLVHLDLRLDEPRHD